MPTVITPKISRITVEFPETDKVRIRLYGFRLIEEDGEDPVIADVSPKQALVPASVSEVAAWLALVLAKAKIKFGREDIEFDFPPEEEP